MAKTQTAEDDNYDPMGDAEGSPHAAEVSGSQYEGVTAERPDPAARAGVTVERKTTVTAPSLFALAAFIDELAEDIDAETGGEVTGRSTKAKQEAVGKAKGLREAASLVRAAKLTG